MMVGVDGLIIDNYEVNFSAPYDATNNAWSCYISGDNIQINNIRCFTAAATTWSDGIHFAYINNLTLTNFIFDTGDDGIALHYPNAAWTNSGENTASNQVTISNGVIRSRIANSIRIGASSAASHSGNAYR